MLHHQRVVNSGATPRRRAFIVHGIMGSGGNWRSLARRLASQAPDWEFVLVDLRNHGRSPVGEPPHTLAACAADLDRLAAELGGPPELLIGHSFGGKVALKWAETGQARQVWALDASAGSWDMERARESQVAQVIAALRRVPLPLERREDLLQLLGDMGLSNMLARWMTTNLTRGEGGLVWTFDLDVIEALMIDYGVQDLWPILEDTERPSDIHVVRAARSDRWTDEELARYEVLPPEARVTLRTLPKAGHWLHVDNPGGLMDMLLRVALSG